MKKIHYYLVTYFKILTPLLCLVIFLIGFFLFIHPGIKKIFSNDLDSKVLEKKLLSEKDKFNRLTNLKENFEKIDFAALQKIKKIIPDNDELLNFIIFLENLVRENNFSIPGLNFSLSKTSDHSLSSIQTNLTLSGGNYQSFKNLLKIFEKNLRIIDIDSVSLSPVTATYSISLKTYFLPTAEKKFVSEFPDLKKISNFIQSNQFLTLEERRELIIPIENIQIGRPNPFLPF
ncbi:MAG: hypothetical protein N2259_02855 [Patescibacteria group bacterium]|nr:hypothetical protein [Patescibacteria group bacterium]